MVEDGLQILLDKSYQYTGEETLISQKNPYLPPDWLKETQFDGLAHLIK